MSPHFGKKLFRKLFEKLFSKTLPIITNYDIISVPVDVDSFHGKSINLVQGDRLHLKCNVHGHPEFTIVWYKGVYLYILLIAKRN